MPRSFALGEHFEQFIESQLKTGRFNNASEVVRAGLRLLEDSVAPPALTLDELRNLIREGMDSGPGRPAGVVLDRLEEKYRRLSEAGDDG